jgi:tetratricopeptide (TPR) repeat protein
MDDDLRHVAAQHFAQGNTLDERGDRDGAIKEWQEAIDIDPDLAAAHFNLGIAYADEDETELAIHELREALRLEPFDVQARRELADLYLEQDRLEDAVHQLHQALTVAPSDGETAHQLAAAYLDHEMWDQASGALESGALLEQDADLWFQLGNGYAREQRGEDAILAYRRALVCQPDHQQAEQALRRLHVPLEEPPDPDEGQG